MVVFSGNQSWCIIPSLSQNTVAILFPADFAAFTLRVQVHHISSTVSIDFWSPVHNNGKDSSLVTIRSKESSSTLYLDSTSPLTLILSRFCSFLRSLILIDFSWICAIFEELSVILSS